MNIRFFMSILLILWTIAPMANAWANAWKNPANKYINAHKAYSNATCPIAVDTIQHFVYFARDRDAIRGHALLKSSRFQGAQIMYSWKHLEPQKGVYDFSIIKDDVDYLARYGKTLFIQLQDASFSTRWRAVPNYLLTDEFDGGIAKQFRDDGTHFGWVAKRWSAPVRERFRALMQALSHEVGDKIAGINLQETAIGVSAETDPTFSEERNVQGIKDNMKALAETFPNTPKLVYANFIRGEWLPYKDKGYLKSIYQYGEKIGVGFGSPDLLMHKKGHLNHPIAMMHENNFSVPLGIAIQDGNYVGQTNSHQVKKERTSLVPKLHAFAKDFLRIDYMFWVNQAPYFEEDVLPCFAQ